MDFVSYLCNRIAKIGYARCEQKQCFSSLAGTLFAVELQR